MMKRWMQYLRSVMLLRRIARVLNRKWGYRLNKRQKRAILNPDEALLNLDKWGRATGKTVTACVWWLVHGQRDVDVERESVRPGAWDKRGYLAVDWRRLPPPDPDNRVSRNAHRHNLEMLRNIYRMCVESGIRFPFVIR